MSLYIMVYVYPHLDIHSSKEEGNQRIINGLLLGGW